jgi:peptidyl-prolyl cis-trans isomerase SurA
MKRAILYAAALLTVTSAAASAQPAPGDRIGRVLAIVGDSVVLNFDVQAGLLAWQQQTRTPTLPTGAERAQLERDIIEGKIAELLMVQAAVKDTTIKVTDEQIEKYVQQRIDEDARQMGGQVGLEKALLESGRTLADYRQLLTTQTRKRAYIEQYQNKQRQERKMPPVTDKEMKAFFESQPAPPRPATIDFNQVVVRTQPADSAIAKAKLRADSVLQMIRNGEDFAELAKRYGQDASKEMGGDLGWIRRGGVVKPFADAAFRMRAGDVSVPVLSQFGWHIIKVEKQRGAEIQARHILFMPELTDNDALRARARADSAADQLRAGVDPDTVAFRFGDRDMPVRYGTTELDTVKASLGIDLSGAKAGDVIGPLPQGASGVATEFLVLQVIGREDARPWRYDDPQMRDRLRTEIARNKLELEIVNQLKRDMYVEIREIPGGGAPDK